MSNNYQYQNFEQTTQQNKKPYNDCEVFVLFPKGNFISVNPGANTKIVCFVKILGEQFGEAIPYSLKEGEIIQLLCFDENNSLFLKQNMVSTDTKLGEFQYTFKDFDLDNVGVFECEISLNSTTIGKFKLNVNGNYNVFETVTLFNSDNTPSPDLTIINLDNASAIISNIQYVSFEIISNGNILSQFMINEVTNINFNNSEILIFTGETFTKLIFPNNIIAQNAFVRINDIMNGKLIS